MTIIFWNVDTQYDFMRDDESFKGALPISGAKEIEKNLEIITNAARQYNIQIVNTADWHTEKSAEFSNTPDYQKTFPPHCLQGTKGAEFIPATKPCNPLIVSWQDKVLGESLVANHKGDLILYKDHFSVFEGNPHTQKVLDLIKPKLIVVYGVAADVCVKYAVDHLLLSDRHDDFKDMYLEQPPFIVAVVEDAVKQLPGNSLYKTLSSFEYYGAKIITTKDLMGGLKLEAKIDLK